METEDKMAYKPVGRLIMQMSAPPIISMFMQYSYNLVDSMFVARINEQATDKVVPSMTIQLLRQGVLLVPLMWLLNRVMQIAGIWIAFPVTEIIVCAGAVLLMKKKKIAEEKSLGRLTGEALLS